MAISMGPHQSMQEKSEIIPIFVLGSARNGTTWLGNVLCRHPEIVGAEHKAHWGQHECHAYLCHQYVGDLRNDYNLIRFLELYSTADFFQLVEGDKEFFYQNRPENFFDFFLTLMDRYARKKKVRHWVAKLDPLFYYHDKELRQFLALLQRRYHTFHFISIKREFQSVLQSYLHMEGDHSIHQLPPLTKRLATFLESARYVEHYRVIERLIRSHQGLAIAYEDLRHQSEDQLRQICQFLSLNFSTDMMQPAYKPNSSFLHAPQTSDVSTFTVWCASTIYTKIFALCPPLAWALLRLRDLTRPKTVPFSWRLLRLKYQRESFANELKRTGQIALYQMLFEDQEADWPTNAPR